MQAGERNSAMVYKTDVLGGQPLGQRPLQS